MVWFCSPFGGKGRGSVRGSVEVSLSHACTRTHTHTHTHTNTHTHARTHTLTHSTKCFRNVGRQACGREACGAKRGHPHRSGQEEVSLWPACMQPAFREGGVQACCSPSLSLPAPLPPSTPCQPPAHTHSFLHPTALSLPSSRMRAVWTPGCSPHFSAWTRARARRRITLTPTARTGASQLTTGRRWQRTNTTGERGGSSSSSGSRRECVLCACVWVCWEEEEEEEEAPPPLC
jgi:hypothetical protein